MQDRRDNPRPQTPRDQGGLGASLRSAWELAAHPIAKVCYEPLAAHYEERYRKKFPKHHSKVLILDLVLLFVAGGLTVFWIFANAILPLIPLPALVSIEMLAPKDVVSGAPTDYVISYVNDSPHELACAEIRVALPDDTVLETTPRELDPAEKTCYAGTHDATPLADPSEPGTYVIPVGMIGPNGRDAVRFKARTYGPTGSVKTMTAELRYWESGATQPTRVTSRNEWQVTGSTLALGIDAPDVTARGQARTVKVTYANRGEDALAGTVIRLAVPDDFTVTGSVPSAASRGEWRVGALKPGQEGAITVFGYFRPTSGGEAPTFAARGYVQAGGKLTLAELVRKNADPGAADVELTTDLASPAGRTALLPGEEVRVTVAYRNAGRHSLKNMRIALDPGGVALQNASPASLAWEPSSEPSLADVKPGSSGSFTAIFVVPQVLPGGAAPSLHLSAGAQYEIDEEPGHAVRIDTPVIDLPIATRLTVGGTALYYTKDGDQLGVGPLPPKVGATTKYRVFLTVATTTGAADDVVVEATLPPNVAWTGQASVTAGESLDHFTSNGRVRWTIGRVPENVGEETKFGATFEVGITPDKAAAGSAPLLLTNIKVTGKDAATGLILHASAENITTDLPYDPRAAGKGTVLE